MATATAEAVRLVYVEKDGELRTHRAKPKQVKWSNDTTTTEQMPACGTKVDVTALMSYMGDEVEITCGRCSR